QAEDGIRDRNVTGVQTCALPILDAAVAEHFKVLGLVPVLRLGVRERVNHAYPFDGRLRRTVHRLGLGQAGRFEDGRGDVDDVMRSEERRVGKEGRIGWWGAV